MPGDGYLATASGAGLGVVVISEGGVTPHLREVCDRLVGEGFTAFAPDLEAGSVERLLDHEAVRGDGVGVIAFSSGGAVRALRLAAAQGEKVRAVVPFYGLPAPKSAPDWAGLHAAVEGHFAEHDDRVEVGAVAALEETLSALGKDVRLFTYPGTRRGFFDDSRPELYDADAARQAWVRTLEFLRAKLG